MASDIEARAGEFTFATMSVADAVDAPARRRPVALVDSADNVGGGSPGDGTPSSPSGWLGRVGPRGITDGCGRVQVCFKPA